MPNDLESSLELLPGLEDAPDGWEFKLLRDLVDEERGISYGIVQPGSHQDEGIPIVRVNNIVAGRLSEGEVFRVSPEIEAKYKRTRLRGGEVLLTVVGAYFGESTVVPREFAGWNVARAVAVIPIAGDIDPYWVCTCLHSPLVRHCMLTWATTTAQPTLNLADVARLPIALPPKPEREAIAALLGALDDKIELNRRMNETLEAMAQALFRAWFADATQASFPKGWHEGKVSELATLSRHGLNPGDFPDESFDHYSIPAFDEGRAPKPETGDAIKSNKFIVSPDCVLVSKLNPRIPRVWLPDLRGANRAICSTEFLVTSPKPGVSREFLFCLFTNESFASVFATMVTGTSGSHQRVKPESLMGMDTLLPPHSLIESFTETTAPLLKRMNHNIAESCTLAALRDALLPKLLSGELRVPE